ncbi:MAG: ArnT family glycosyltransferase [Hyphomonadaceae bacterium]
MRPAAFSPERLLDRWCAGLRGYALIALIALAAALPGVFRVPPLDRDEARFAQATVQMLETGDFLRIAVQDAPRNKKPIGIHWLQAASVAALSSPEAREVWAYRLVSAAGALLAALACLWGGTVLVGRKAAFLGAALYAATLLAATEAMIAKTDSVLCGLTTLALAALARLRFAPARPRALALVFWAALGLGVLIKGPVTPLAAGLCLAALFFWERQPGWMRPLLWPAGPALAAAIAAPWFIAIGMATKGAFFAEAVGGDIGGKLTGGDEGHGGPPGYHLLLAPLLLFPAIIAAPAAVRLAAVRLRAGGAQAAPLRFLIAWAAPLWAVFEIMPTKLPHYVLPAYPALALLCGAGLIAAYEQNWRKTRLSGALFFLFAVAGMAAACAFLSTLAPGDVAAGARRALQCVILLAAIFLALLVAFIAARGPGVAAASAVAAALVFAFTARERILPEARAWLVSAETNDALIRAGLHPRLSPHAGALISSGFNEPSFIFLTRTDTRLLPGQAAGDVAQPGETIVVEARQRAALAQALRARGLAFEAVGGDVEGFNYAGGDPVKIAIGRVRAAGDAPETARSPPP